MVLLWILIFSLSETYLSFPPSFYLKSPVILELKANPSN